jgi:hypothetical protein
VAAEEATKALTEAAKMYGEAANQIGSLQSENRNQDARQDGFEQELREIKAEVVDGNATSLAIANEMNLLPKAGEPEKADANGAMVLDPRKAHPRKGAITKLTQQNRTGALLIILVNLTTALAYLLSHGK